MRNPASEEKRRAFFRNAAMKFGKIKKNPNEGYREVEPGVFIKSAY